MRKTNEQLRSGNVAISSLLIVLAVLFLPAACQAETCCSIRRLATNASVPPSRAATSGPTISASGVVSASAFGGFTSIAPGSWIEVYGSNLASETRSWASSDFNGVNAPTSLGGTSVSIGGQSAFVDYISPTQVNAQVPSGVGAGQQQVIVTVNTVASNAYAITVNSEQPGLLAPASFDIGGKQYVAALFSDGVTYVLPPGAIPGVPSRRAQPGDNITLYGVGFGPVIPNIPAGQIVQQDNSLAVPFQLNFGQAQATLTYDGLAPQAVGLYQFNVTVPTIASSDAVPVAFTLGGMAGAQTLYVPVQSGNSGPLVQSLTLSPTSVAGGGTVQGTIVLSEPALAGGAVVALSSSSSAASVPATVTVPANATSATVTVSTTTASSNQTAIITAFYGGASAQASLSITPSSGTGTLPTGGIDINALFSTATQTGTPGSGSITVYPTAGTGHGPGYGMTDASTGFSGGPITEFIVEFQTTTENGLTLTVQSPDSTSIMIVGESSATITSGTMTLTFTAPDALGDGTVTGTFTLTSSLATVSGTISGSYISID